MGKSQTKKKTRQIRHNPMRVPDAHLGSGKASQVDQGKEKQMLPILRKLSAPEYSDRTWACAAISNLVQGDAATRRMFQGNNVVGALIERLSDGVDEVVVEASGALRNLAIDGGHELCAEMFNKGIMSHLTVLITKCTATINTIIISPPATTLNEAEYQARKHLLGLTENVLSLVWSLAEANHKTLAAVNAAGVEELLFLGLQGREVLGTGVALAAAQAMYSLSQDNPDFQRKVLRNPAAIQSLVEIVSADHHKADAKRKGKGKASGNSVEAEDGRALLLRALVAGSLRNIVGASPDQKLQADLKTLTNETILPLVNGLLDIDLSALVQQVMQHVTAMGQADQQPKTLNGASTDHRSPAEIALENIERMLMTIIVGLEILTGICAGVDDVEEVEEQEAVVEETGDSDDEMDGDDEEMDDDENALFDKSREVPVNGASNTNGVSTPVTLPHLLSTLNLPSRLSALATLTALSLPPASSQPSPHPPTTSALSVLHLRALEALNNLLLTVVATISTSSDPSVNRLASLILVGQVWTAVFRNVDSIWAEREAIRQKGQEMRMEILEGCVGCLWGLAKIAPDNVGVTLHQESTLVDAVTVLSSDLAKTRAIEILSALAARSTVTIEENREISKWLVGLLNTPLESEMLVAVLNAIIDIFSDETRPYDHPVFVAGGYLQILSDAVSRVRAKVKQIDRRKELRLRARAEEASDNLSAFVQYRKSLGR